uniref:Uncharacterized protein n=1 Tax=Arundo donax TaxID=35708 RepID=A0A0A9FPN5_ARUDO
MLNISNDRKSRKTSQLQIKKQVEGKKKTEFSVPLVQETSCNDEIKKLRSPWCRRDPGS